MALRSWKLMCAASLLFLSAAVPLTARRQSIDAAPDKPPRFTGLTPGKFVVYKQQIPVDVVLIGFDQNQVNQSDLLAALPAAYSPVVRYPRFYGLDGRNMGLQYQFKYSI